MIKIEDKNILVSEDTFMYLQKPFENFEISKLKLEIIKSDDNYFQVLYSYSYDKINYADFKIIDDYAPQDNVELPIYVGIYFHKIIATDLQKVLSLQQQSNVNSDLHSIEVVSLKYDNVDIDLYSEAEIKFSTIYDIVNQFPRWNFYDGQQVNIDHWKKRINSIVESYGHTCIYFKTEPIETTTEHTFKNHVFRNVTSIKKLHIMFPGNEIPQDRTVYSEWDMPMQDDVVIHIVKDKFDQAFGDFKLPLEKDYLFIPLLNKLYRVSASQPKNGFMGKIGWWEVYLAKFEDDECVTIDDELKKAMEGIEDFDIAIDSIDTLDDTLKSELFSELDDFKNQTVMSVEKIAEKTTAEKMEATQGYTNKLVDSTTYISIKETESQREFYDNRLAIVSVNPDSSAFPITMYDNSTVSKRVVAMQYNLGDYTIKNKISTTLTKNFRLSFNYVLLNNFVGEVFDLLSTSGNLSIFTLKNNRNKIEIIDNGNQTVIFDFQLIKTEIYNIIFDYDITINQISIKIFSLKNNTKILDFQHVYIISEIIKPAFELKYIQLFGGNFYSNEIILNIDNKQIMKDYVNPLLIMRQF